MSDRTSTHATCSAPASIIMLPHHALLKAPNGTPWPHAHLTRTLRPLTQPQAAPKLSCCARVAASGSHFKIGSRSGGLWGAQPDCTDGSRRWLRLGLLSALSVSPSSTTLELLLLLLLSLRLFLLLLLLLLLRLAALLRDSWPPPWPCRPPRGCAGRRGGRRRWPRCRPGRCPRSPTPSWSAR